MYPSSYPSSYPPNLSSYPCMYPYIHHDVQLQVTTHNVTSILAIPHCTIGIDLCSTSGTHPGECARRRACVWSGSSRFHFLSAMSSGWGSVGVFGVGVNVGVGCECGFGRRSECGFGRSNCRFGLGRSNCRCFSAPRPAGGRCHSVAESE